MRKQRNDLKSVAGIAFVLASIKVACCGVNDDRIGGDQPLTTLDFCLVISRSSVPGVWHDVVSHDRFF